MKRSCKVAIKIRIVAYDWLETTFLTLSNVSSLKQKLSVKYLRPNLLFQRFRGLTIVPDARVSDPKKDNTI